MLFWTHIFDLLAKLAGMALSVAMFLLSVPDPPAKGHPIIFALCFLTGMVIWWVGLRPLSSWLHARVRLGAPLSWGQARRASMLFSPMQDILRWHPLWQVLHMPKEERVAAIEAAMEALQAEYDAKAASLRAAPALSRAIRWMNLAVLVIAIVLTIANLPPASWISAFQARAFDGAYYPLLTGILLALPLMFMLSLLNHATAPSKVTAVDNPPSAETHQAPAISSTVSARVPPPREQEKVNDPNDHSRFAPPSR